MRARISCGGSDRGARSLMDWLRRVEELRGRVDLVAAPVPPGRMGGISDVVGIALSGGGAATVLIRSVFTWLRQRPRGTHLLVDLEETDGRKVHLELSSADNCDEAIRKVLTVLEDPVSELETD
ncbi:hypothetical protein [Amycolatopsis sp. NPDC052450]|uniref:effector-associated constant component EACC1 n=1 Tax=Amycolatopsis sp. NPDC052450 TaxID=3363937 RepID=UPI0037C89E40